MEHDSSNLAFVGALVSYGASITKVDRTDLRRVVFTVDISPIKRVYVLRGDSVEKLVPVTSAFYNDLLNLFVSDKLMLMPNYMTKITDLKSLIYG